MNKTADNGAKALLKRIEETAFFAHYSLMGDGNVRPYDWEKVGARLTGLEKDLWKFFLLGGSFTKAEAEQMLGSEALNFLVRHKLCTNTNGKLMLDKLWLLRYCGMTCFVKYGGSTWSFIGEDTKALLAFLPRLTRGRCLSLFTSGGVEIMPLVSSSVEMTFADLKGDENILRANLELNAAEGPASWQFSRNGSGAYDLIVSNPPFMFQPPGIKMPKYAAGGPDGLKCVRKFLQAAGTELKPDGVAITTFAFFADNDSRAMEQRLRALLDGYGLNYVVAVSSKLLMEPGVPLFNQLLASAASATNAPEVETLVKKIMNHAQRKKLAAVHLLKGRFWKAESGKPAEQQITNYSDAYYGTWII